MSANASSKSSTGVKWTTARSNAAKEFRRLVEECPELALNYAEYAFFVSANESPRHRQMSRVLSALVRKFHGDGKLAGPNGITQWANRVIKEDREDKENELAARNEAARKEDPNARQVVLGDAVVPERLTDAAALFLSFVKLLKLHNPIDVADECLDWLAIHGILFGLEPPRATVRPKSRQAYETKFRKDIVECYEKNDLVGSPARALRQAHLIALAALRAYGLPRGKTKNLFRA